MSLSRHLDATYEQLSLLDRGNYGAVYKGRNKKTNELVAIKRIPATPDSQTIKYVISEIETQQQARHVNIVALLAFERTPTEAIIVMEYCGGGTLSAMLQRYPGGRFPLHIVKRFTTQLALALEFMNKKNIIHRDLKPVNILMTSTDPERAEIKIADFGFARTVNDMDMAQTTCGTPLYMAPEVLEGKPYGPKSDLWSAGCIIFQMTYGRVPFDAASQAALLRVISASLKLPPKPAIPADLKELLVGLLTRNVPSRFSHDDLLMSSFLGILTVTPQPNSPQIQEVASLSNEQLQEPARNEMQLSSSRPRTNLFKDSSSTMSSDYVIVNKEQVEVNHFADGIALASPPNEMRSPNLPITQRRPSVVSPPMALSPSNFSKVVAMMEKIVSPDNFATDDDKNPLTKLLEATTTPASTAAVAVQNIEEVGHQAVTLYGIAMTKISSLKEMDVHSYFEAYILLLCTLDLCHITLKHVKNYWSSSKSVQLHDLVQYLRQMYNTALEKADELKRQLQLRSNFGAMKPRDLMMYRMKLLFDLGRQKATAAAMDEMLDHRDSSLRQYRQAILVLSAALQPSLSESMLVATDQKAIFDYLESIKKRYDNLNTADVE